MTDKPVKVRKFRGVLATGWKWECRERDPICGWYGTTLTQPEAVARGLKHYHAYHADK